MIKKTTKMLLLLALQLLAGAALLHAQAATGTIVGHVVDANTARPLSGVQVYVGDGTLGSLTDLDGRFVITPVPVGGVSVHVQLLGYAAKTVTDVEMSSGRVFVLDIGLEASAVELEEIVITADRERGSQAFLFSERMTSEAIVEAIGSAEINKRSDSDAAEVAQRMSGVTVSEGKYVFIRGMGGRYSQTSLNGSSLPSPEPEREVVPLDLFPAGFLESLKTQKTYTPDLPADFSGGAIEIRTKDFPDRFTMRFGMGTSINTNSQFQGGFLGYSSGGLDWLGFDDGSRSQPEAVKRLMGPVASGGRLPSDPVQRIEIGQAFQSLDRRFTPNARTTPVNRDLNMSVGGRKKLFQDGELGYTVAGTYSDKYSIVGNDVQRKWRASAFDPGIPAEARTPNVDYLFTRGKREIAWGTIGNLTVRLNPEQKLSIRTTVNLSSEDEARRYEGDNREDIGGLVRSDRSRFVSRLMLWGQLSGEHRLFADSRLEWRGTVARASRDEPMLRESVYTSDGPDEAFLLHPIGESGRYFWSNLVDDDMSVALDWFFPFRVLGPHASVKFGGSYRSRTRDFAARRLNWDFIGSTVADIDVALADAHVVASARQVGDFAIAEVVEPGDLYSAEDRRAAGYMMVDVRPVERLRAIFGARVETYKLGLDSREDVLQDTRQIDVAPSLNLIYSISNSLKLRSAISRTVDKPEFRELAPFQFTEATSLRQLFGNPALETARILSTDLRLDWLPTPGELVSIGGFYKSLDEPIEQVFIAAASTAYSFQNADGAEIVGVEADTQLGLRRVSPALEHFFMQANYSWIHSEVAVRGGDIFEPTNLIRPLEGQAKYVFNLGLNWDQGSGVSAGLFYNRFGDRLTAAGGSGIPDLYELPRNSLDLSLGFPLTGGATARIRATNLLDAEYRFEQAANGIRQVQRLYSLGQTISVGLSWEF